MRCGATSTAADLPSSFLLACSKICFHFSLCEAAKRGDNGAERGSVGETEELDHICAVLVTTLTLRQSPQKSKTVPLGGPARRCWRHLLLSFPTSERAPAAICSIVSGAAPGALPEGTGLVGIDADWEQSPDTSSRSNIHAGTPEQAAVTLLCFCRSVVTVEVLFSTPRLWHL